MKDITYTLKLYYFLSENQKEKDLINILDLFLKTLRQHRRLYFVPDETLMQSFIEMGFEIKDIKVALKITGNNGIHAVRYSK